MALADIAQALTEPADSVPHRTCQVCHYADSLAPADRETFEDLLRNRGIKYNAIERAFRDDPDLPTLDYSAIRRHGNGEGGHTVKYR